RKKTAKIIPERKSNRVPKTLAAAGLPLLVPQTHTILFSSLPSGTCLHSTRQIDRDPWPGSLPCLAAQCIGYFDVRRDTCPFWRMMFLQACYTDGHLEEPATVAVLHFHADNGSMDQQEISS
uniref:Uncharacterized protein n=1 Tax=Triticum urartu TaxID=4572 RepID=A0A8R7QQM6_TRIUA